MRIRKHLVYPLLFSLVMVLIDQAMKVSAYGLGGELHFNSGFILGSFSEIPATLRVVSLGSLGGLLFFMMALLFYLMPLKMTRLRYALATFIGGIQGNVIDQIVYGKTLDFIPVKAFGYEIFFNGADAIQWIGAALLAYTVIKKEEQLWPSENQRGQVFIMPKEQLLFSSKLAVVSASSYLICALSCLTFMKVSAGEALPWKVLILAMVSGGLLVSVLAFMAGIYLSHKTVGPVLAFERYVHQLIEGDREKFFLREGDRYQRLQKIAQNLRYQFEEKDEQKKKAS